ncbi:hypothetical protein U9M48_005816 [Paspalum notatum var. saurae]|uniref:Uncharacterized protein n=1 Tax=Paspalum notatum var. saurae TaxID=547442 RepID=A0AAQ3SKA1_PASNO
MGLWGGGDYDDEGGHGGTAAEAQGSDVDGSPTCLLRLYGTLDLRRRPSHLCPQCGKRFSLEHITNLYAPRNLWGGCFRTQASVTSGINAFETELNKQILDMLGEPVSIDIIYRNEDMGNIYTTIDDFHYKLTCIDIYIQAPVTSGASGPEAELNNQVLNILREPKRA